MSIRIFIINSNMTVVHSKLDIIINLSYIEWVRFPVLYAFYLVLFYFLSFQNILSFKLKTDLKKAEFIVIVV